MAEVNDVDFLLWSIGVVVVLFIVGEVQSIITLRRTMKVYELAKDENETDPGN